VAHDDARLAFPAAYLEGHAVPSYGELAAVSGIRAGGLYSGPCLLGSCASGAAIACEITARLDDVRLVADQR
jgi:hypothetical protein